MTARQRGEVDRAQALSDPGLATADDCDGGEAVSRVGLRCPKHLMSCTITLAHTLSQVLVPIALFWVNDEIHVLSGYLAQIHVLNRN